MEIRMGLNGVSEREVKEVLVRRFGNFVGFRESSENVLIVTSTQESVIEDLEIMAGLTIIEEQGT